LLTTHYSTFTFGGAKVRENQQEKELKEILMKAVGITRVILFYGK
jgi:hypothetical protein